MSAPTKEPRSCPFCGEPPIVEPIDWRAEGDSWAGVTCDNYECPAQPSVKNYTNITGFGAKGHAEQKRIAILKWNNALEEHALVADQTSNTRLFRVVPKTDIGFDVTVEVDEKGETPRQWIVLRDKDPNGPTIFDVDAALALREWLNAVLVGVCLCDNYTQLQCPVHGLASSSGTAPTVRDGGHLSGEQGPWWIPTLEVERMMRDCKARKTETLLINRRDLEGLLHDSLLWRQDRAAQQNSANETIAPRVTPVEVERLIEWHKMAAGVTEQTDDFVGARMHRERLRVWQEYRSPQSQPAETTAPVPAGFVSADEVVAAETTVHHEGVRQSYLKACELSLASGLLGDGDRSDLLELYKSLWPKAPTDIREQALCRPVETSAPRCIWRSGCKHPDICKREGQCVLTVEDALAAGRRHVDYILKEEQKRSGK